MRKPRFFVCMDIGGTHITVAMIDSANMCVHEGALAEIKVDSGAPREAILEQWESAINQVIDMSAESVDGMLISIPGPFDYERGISLMDGVHKYQSLLHMDIRSYLANRYNVRAESIRFFNDAQAFLLGEVYYHNIAHRKVVGLTLGTGLGSAFYDGASTVDLNFGLAPFRDGVSEDYISTRGLLGFLQRVRVHDFQNVKQLVESAQYTEGKGQVFDFLSEALVDFVAQYILPLRPDDIILGGSIARASQLFLEKVQAEVPVPIRIASLNQLNLFYGLTSAEMR